MKRCNARSAVLASAFCAALTLAGAPSYAQQPTATGGTTGTSRTPGSEGVAGAAGASANPPGTTAPPASDRGARQTRAKPHAKLRKPHPASRHAGASEAAGSQP